MVGIKQFDTDTVLEHAARVFWRDGFDAASIRTLEAETGLGRGSIYNAFGGKSALFLAALNRYAATEGAGPLAHLANSDTRSGLQDMLLMIATRMDTPGRPWGCLLTNSCVGAGGTPEIEARIAALTGVMQAAMEEAFGRAKQCGQIAADADVVALARFYCAVARGIGVSHKSGAGLAALHDIVTVAMRAWPDLEHTSEYGDYLVPARLNGDQP